MGSNRVVSKKCHYKTKATISNLSKQIYSLSSHHALISQMKEQKQHYAHIKKSKKVIRHLLKEQKRHYWIIIKSDQIIPLSQKEQKQLYWNSRKFKSIILHLLKKQKQLFLIIQITRIPWNHQLVRS